LPCLIFDIGQIRSH